MNDNFDDLLADIPELAELGLILEPVPTPDALRQRIMSSIATTSRFEPLTKTLSDLVKVARDKAADLLSWIDDATKWEPGPGAGITLIHIEGHTGLAANCIAGWVKIEAGGAFPHHEHIGREIVMPVQGSFIDDDGTVYGVGDIAEKAPGTSHSFTVPADGPDLVYLALVWDGVKIGDLVMLPGDPHI